MSPISAALIDEANAKLLPDGTRVIDLVIGTDLDRDVLVDQTVGAIGFTNDPPRLFVRGDGLVRVLVDADGRTRLDPVTDDATTRTVVMRHVRFLKLVKRNGEFVNEATWAPRELLQTIRTLGSWPGLPVVEAVVETPTLRADGSILDEPGYDEQSRLIYAPDPDLEVPAVAREPTRQDVAAAVALLQGDLLGEFPFASQADAANALALLLTPLVRPTLRTVPLALISAPRAGTGKGLLASVGARIATGRPARVFPAPDEEREWGKAIMAMLDVGAVYIFIDEAARLASSRLAAALTADSYTDRRLGATEMIDVPQRATWVAAGNNPELGGDIPRRVYSIRLDATVARPWTRNGWRHPDLEAWTQENRGRLLHALLTIARAWHAAGRPKAPTPVLGGFSDWTATVGGMLHHAGVTGFLGNLTELYDQADDDANQWEAFLLALGTHTAGKTFTTADVANLIARSGVAEVLPDELAVKRGTPGFKTALGKALLARKDTRHGEHGLHLHSPGSNRDKVRLWGVATDSPAGGAVGCGGSTHHTRMPAHAPAYSEDPPQTPAPPALPIGGDRG